MSIFLNSDSCEPINRVFGRETTLTIKKGLQSLIKSFSSVQVSSCSLIGPVIEGVGYYPVLDKNLKLISHPNCWVIGDATGLFRGIIAALLSGYYVMEQIHSLWK